VEAAEDSPQKRAGEGAEDASPSEHLYSDMPDRNEVVLVERIACEFAEARARNASADELQAILREVPRIPRDLDARLLSIVSTALGRHLTGRDPLVRAMRDAFWRALKQISLELSRPTGPPSAEILVTPSTGATQLGVAPTEAASPADKGEPFVEVVAVPPKRKPSRKGTDAKKRARKGTAAKSRPRKGAGTVVGSEAAAPERTAEDVERDAEDYATNPDRWKRPVDNEVMAAVVRISEVDSRRFDANQPKMLKCEDCGKYFPFPCEGIVYYMLLWSKNKTAKEMAHCAGCRKQKGMKAWEETVSAGFLPFLFDPVTGT
jgi:hypothetical protein